MATVLVLVGAGRYADEWHDHAAQGDEVAHCARGLGHEVRVRSTRPSTFADLGPWAPDLLVVTAGGDPTAQPDDAWGAFHDARQAAVAAGAAVLALHQAAYAFADDPRWAATIGGRWVEGRSWHPARGRTRLHVVDDTHPVTAGLPGGGTLAVDDERYADLAVAPDVRALVVATVDAGEADGARTAGHHPVVWVAPGPGRVLFDALGHDAAAYRGDRAALLHRELTWLLPPV
ncbi:ThuA domain-containing protein [Cellulomonas sp.]|uniref:ThuA domain-containing protein n=1 Tax=Cellulomonas sp. TaxID=40001 RepID=UPI00258E812A|nr:ThuA domain-containing protein [Cellulomonas sp.]MCR6689144.1 ThuA domain-containing protein [Cellulomonas sp.]